MENKSRTPTANGKIVWSRVAVAVIIAVILLPFIVINWVCEQTGITKKYPK